MDDTADRVAIAALQGRYADTVTRRTWAELPALFTPDCTIRLDLRERGTMELAGADALVEMLQRSMARFDWFLFAIVSATVEVHPAAGTATGRLYISELRHDADDEPPSTQTYGLYQDTYRRDDGVWRFAGRTYASLARTSPTGIGLDVFPIPGATT